MDYAGEEAKFIVPGVVPKLSKTPGNIERRASTLGEDNHEIYCGLLGLTEEEYKQLDSRKVILKI